LKEIIIRLGSGTIQSGFNNVTVELKSLQVTQWEDRTSLAANPELQQLLNQWQLLYPAALQMLSPGLTLSPVFDTNTVTNVSTQDMVELNYNLRVALNNWLNFGNFARIDRRLRTDLNVLDRILVVIIGEQLPVWQLPWHFWEFFHDYTQAIEVFSKPRFTDVRQIEPQHKGKVNILTLSGRDPHIVLSLPFLKTLPQAYSQPLETTSAHEIAQHLNHTKPWDILIFNGHGDTIRYKSFQDGVIYLDNDTPLEISRLKTEIQIAVNRGLQIAIFNCCNGLGLAEQLSDLNIPYIIVMREIVPNQCAQDFLKQLLTQYSQGDSFPAAFKRARDSLKLTAGGFAQFADWLPILFHNPLSDRVTWRDLAATAFSKLIPPQVTAACRYLSQPNHRMSINFGLSSLLSIFALHLQSQPQIIAGENGIIDRLQAAQVERLARSSSPVTMVNYDAVSLLGLVSHDRDLHELIQKVTAKSKPTAWSIGLDINNPTTIFEGNIFRGCIDRPTNSTTVKSRFRLNRCDRDSAKTILENQGLVDPVPPEFRLNPNLLIGSSHRIDRVNLSEILDRSIADANFHRLFDGKTIVVGYFNGKELNSVARAAIAIDQITRAHDLRQFLPLLIYRSISEQLLWIFGWSILTGIVAWQDKWKLLFFTTIFGEIAIAGILFFLGQGLPIVVTSIAMLSIGGVVRIIVVGADKDRRLLN
jgi:hypothetical protein